jgi:ribosomal protein S20
MVGTRTVVQIRTHAQKYFQKINKGRAKEDRILSTAEDSIDSAFKRRIINKCRRKISNEGEEDGSHCHSGDEVPVYISLNSHVNSAPTSHGTRSKNRRAASKKKSGTASPSPTSVGDVIDGIDKNGVFAAAGKRKRKRSRLTKPNSPFPFTANHSVTARMGNFNDQNFHNTVSSHSLLHQNLFMDFGPPVSMVNEVGVSGNVDPYSAYVQYGADAMAADPWDSAIYGIPFAGTGAEIPLPNLNVNVVNGGPMVTPMNVSNQEQESMEPKLLEYQQSEEDGQGKHDTAPQSSTSNDGVGTDTAAESGTLINVVKQEISDGNLSACNTNTTSEPWSADNSVSSALPQVVVSSHLRPMSLNSVVGTINNVPGHVDEKRDVSTLDFNNYTLNSNGNDKIDTDNGRGNDSPPFDDSLIEESVMLSLFS